MFKFTYVATMRNIVMTETFLAISESKVDYVTTQKFDAQVNLCCDIQKYCRNNVFLFLKHRLITILSCLS